MEGALWLRAGLLVVVIRLKFVSRFSYSCLTKEAIILMLGIGVEELSKQMENFTYPIHYIQ